jgi:ATP-dependent RNA helicase DeaD
MTFSEIGLSPEILSAVADLGYTQPTPIQEKAIPLILSQDHDLVALAQTGTGKTAAFGLPIIGQIDYQVRSIQALMLAPTRELCVQITKDLEKFGAYCKGFKVAAVYGGASIEGQIKQLQRGPQIVVGTPGRTLDMIRRGALRVEAIRWLVLDEADEMLKMGFQEDMDAILAATPETRQTLLFSATMPQEIVGMTKRYMKSPEEISMGVKNKGATNVEHWYYVVHPKDKYLALKRIADLHPDIYGIVFCKTRMETQEIATALIEDSYNADALHGDLSQAQRDQVMARFRSGHLQLLIATDVAARGLDVDDLTHVINYRLPDHLDSYIHRSGRTGRAGKNGISISIIAPRDKRLLKTLEYQVGKPFLQKRIPGGSEIVQQQLVNYVAKIVDTQVDAERLAPLMDPVYERLSYLTREELIQKFVGMEFSRMLSYYQRANDLNADLSSGSREDRGDRRGREERFDRRDDRQESGNSRERRDRHERTAGRPERTFEERPTWERRPAKTDRPESIGRGEFMERPERSDKAEEHSRFGAKGFTRYFINLGSKNQLTAPKLIDMINSNDEFRAVQIGKIEILKKFSFFELETSHLGDAASLLSGQDYDGTVTHVEPAEAPKTPALTKEKSFGFGDPKKRATGFSGRGSQGTGFSPRNSEFRKGGDGFGFQKRERKESEGGFWSKASVGSKAVAKPVKSSSVEKASKPKRLKGSLSSLD